MKYFIFTLKCFGIGIAMCIIGFIAWALWFTSNFHGDTYADAEEYIIMDDNIKALDWEKATQWGIDTLYGFQMKHPEYCLLTTNAEGQMYHNFKAIKTYQYNPDLIFFYFKDKNITISCIVETSSKNQVLIKLYAVNEGVIFRKWKRINNYEEISRKENKIIKKKFETEILDQLGVKWRHERWWD